MLLFLFKVSLIFLSHYNSDMLDVVLKKQEEDRPNVTPDSSTTVNSKSDLDNSLILFQVILILCCA